jgi:hypothetical protein
MGSIAKYEEGLPTIYIINEETRKYLIIYEETISHICNLSLLNFLIYEKKFYFIFYQ